jgi:beta-1,4-mannosyl-glycoprotein beta-1,4-N-acetylglucosaminyltransferase
MVEKKMKVIDCFPFYNELDLLEIRLNELKDVVDVFVLTESPQTFTGKDKPLYFQENKKRFKKFNIVHSVFEDKTDCHSMERERRQKQFNLDYAFDNVFEKGDVIMYGDCDEIPKASVIKKVLEGKWKSVGLVPTLYYYYLNCRQVGEPNSSKASIRLVRPEKKIVYDVTRSSTVDKLVKDAGYHFSYLDDIAYKLESWGHANQFNRPPYNDPEHIKKCKETGQDFLMRRGRRRLAFEFVEDLSYLPEYVLKNIKKFKQYIWIKQ